MLKKRRTGFYGLAVLSAVLLTACGGVTDAGNRNGKREHASASEPAVSATAVTGGAVSNCAVTEQGTVADAVQGPFSFANSTDFYVDAGKKNENEDSFTKEGIARYTLSGQAKGSRKIPGYKGLFSVTEEGLYYVAETDVPAMGDKLVRIPIRKGKDGTDVLEWEKEEVLLTDKKSIYTGFGCGLISGRYIYYASDSGLNHSAVKYDRLEKREISRTNLGREYPVTRNDDEDEEEDASSWYIWKFIQYGEQVYVFVHEGTLVPPMYVLTQRMDADGWKKVTELTDNVVTASDEEGLYVSILRDDNQTLELLALDEAGNSETLVSDREIKNFLVKENRIDRDFDYYEFSTHMSLELWKDKLYIQAYLYHWSEGTEQWVIISFDRKTGKLSLEQKLMEQIQANHTENLSKELKEKLEHEIFPGMLELIHKGCAIYSEFGLDGWHFFSYDMRTEKKKRLTKKDSELYYVAYASNRVWNTEELKELQKS